jgi:hypothetical protein
MQSTDQALSSVASGADEIIVQLEGRIRCQEQIVTELIEATSFEAVSRLWVRQCMPFGLPPSSSRMPGIQPSPLQSFSARCPSAVTLRGAAASDLRIFGPGQGFAGFLQVLA